MQYSIYPFLGFMNARLYCMGTLIGMEAHLKLSCMEFVCVIILKCRLFCVLYFSADYFVHWTKFNKNILLMEERRRSRDLFTFIVSCLLNPTFISVWITTIPAPNSVEYVNYVQRRFKQKCWRVGCKMHC